MDEEIDLEEILNELELEGGDEADDEVVAEGDDEEEDLDEIHRPHYEADEVQLVNPKAEYVHEDKEFDLDALLEEINNLDEDENKVNEEEAVEEPAEETNEIVGALAGVAGLVAAAGGLSALETAAEDPEWRAKYPKVASALGKLQSMGAAAGQAMRKEQEERDAELAETKEALTTIKSELNEVNLLNSKLLYVNRIFKANNLDEGQKLRVVETLDNADTVKEAKLIYETIKDTFNVAKSKKESIKTKTKSIKEGLGMASRAAGTSTAPRKEIIAESDNMVSRFQKLANIKINQ